MERLVVVSQTIVDRCSCACRCLGDDEAVRCISLSPSVLRHRMTCY